MVIARRTTFSEIPPYCWPASSGWRNTQRDDVAMDKRKRRSARSDRKPLGSPGPSPVAGRKERLSFRAGIAAGLSSEDARASAGIPHPGTSNLPRPLGESAASLN